MACDDLAGPDGTLDSIEELDEFLWVWLGIAAADDRCRRDV